MEWIKKGLIYVPDKTIAWSQSHAQVPIPDFIEDRNIIRIYFSTRNNKNQSQTSYIEVDADNPQKVLFISTDKPALEIGKPGTFDDCGAMPSWIVNYQNKKYLYYIGWNVRNTVPYHNSVGLAISENGITFKKFSEGPLWDRDYIEPYFSASSCVLIENNVWKNWYLSCTEYREINGKLEPRYHLKYAESEDGINWRRNGVVAIDYKDDNEAGIVKASVIKNGDKYQMWFSYRNFLNYRTDILNSYKIGYAESNDGINWVRMDDKSGITTSESGWDKDMIAYPHVIKVKDNYLMFYNGNGFGESGFGYAQLAG